MDGTSSLENAEIRLAKGDEPIRSCYKIMHQLRPHLTSEQAFVSQVQRQIQEGYSLVYVEDGGQVKALTVASNS